ncbi:MAG: sigma factor-like helix-turn-helix DNA-binding protein [Candidatus Pacebacteria bacterium]|nr:sigma factor-like helix-turn-helix DNA-binding protein [Candidatus Paceibacterota bacterium]
MEYNYIKICSSLLNKLPKRTKEIISRRFGFIGKKESLALIGQSFGITRERVRQIEKDGLSSIDIKKEKPVFDYFLKTLNSLGGVKKEQEFLSLLSDKKNHVFFLLSLSPDIRRKPEDKDFYAFYYNKKQDLNNIKKNINKALSFLEKKNKPVEIKEINKIISETQLELCKKIKKDPEGRIGLGKWLEINPRGVKDKAFLIFKKIGQPLHFAQVASLIENSPFANSQDKVYVSTVHNELIKDSRFVLVGRGIYALKEWGYEPGIVRDLITDLLREKGPLPKNIILKTVLKKRLVQENTVYLNLQNKKRFLRDEKGRYFVREIEQA